MAHDTLWYFAKIAARHSNGFYDLTYEDGDVENNKDPNFVRELNLRERKQPRGNKNGRMYWSRKDRAWIAYHEGRRRVPGCHATIEECEKALDQFHAANTTASQSSARETFQTQRNAMLAASSAARNSANSMITRTANVRRRNYSVRNDGTSIGGRRGRAPKMTCAICLESTNDCDEQCS